MSFPGRAGIESLVQDVIARGLGVVAMEFWERERKEGGSWVWLNGENEGFGAVGLAGGGESRNLCVGGFSCIPTFYSLTISLFSHIRLLVLILFLKPFIPCSIENHHMKMDPNPFFSGTRASI